MQTTIAIADSTTFILANTPTMVHLSHNHLNADNTNKVFLISHD